MKDLIYRQDAIDALCNDYCGGHQDCKYYPKCENLKSIQKLPSAQPESQWISCSDENPKADGRYLITGKMGTVYSLDFEDGRWYGGIKPVAWMPLPKPYAERREE